MSRKPNIVTEITPIPSQDGFQEIVKAQDVMTSLSNAYTDERDHINQLMGQVQMAHSIGRFVDVINLSKLKTIKENKTYKALSGKSGVSPSGVKITDIGTWEGFCQALGFSREKIDQDLLNLDFFGEDVLNNLTSIGAGYRELRQYRKLPEDQRSALIEVAKTGDKETFVELAEEVISKHLKEKETLTQKLMDAEATSEAKERILVNKEKTIQKLQVDLSKLQRQISETTPDQELEKLRLEFEAEANHIEALVRQSLSDGASLLVEKNDHAYVAARLAVIVNYLHEIKDSLDLPSVAINDVKPEWASN